MILLSRVLWPISIIYIHVHPNLYVCSFCLPMYAICNLSSAIAINILNGMLVSDSSYILLEGGSSDTTCLEGAIIE